MKSIFPSFCHITEYSEEGYRNLHRLIATSDELTLWAPSWALVKSYHEKGICRVSPDLLLNLLDERQGIQVIGREEWLTDKKYRSDYRKKYGFEGAEWSKYDERLLSILKNDERGRVPVDAMAVKVAPIARGWDAAAEFLAKYPRMESEIESWIKKKKVPIGSLDKIREKRYPDKRPAEVVVRDAVNHADAARLSGAGDPWLSARDGRFLQLMNQAAPRRSKPTPTADEEKRYLQNLKTAVANLLGDLDQAGLSVRTGEEDLRVLVRRIAEHFGRRSAKSFDHTFKGFLKSEGRKNLLEWMRTYSGVLRHVPSERLSQAVRELALAPVKSHSRRGWSIREAFDVRGPALSRFQVLGASLLTVLGAMVDPSGTLEIAGIAFGVLPAVRHSLYQFGILPGDAPGAQFPFPYGFGYAGRYPTLRMIGTVISTLERPSSRRNDLRTVRSID